MRNTRHWLSDRNVNFGHCRLARRLALLNRLRAIFSAAVFFAVPSAAFAGPPTGDPIDEGKSTFDAIKDQWSSPEALSTNLGTPLTADAPMTTLDGSLSFAGSVSCASSQNFLELFFGVGAGGDITPVSVKQDTNFDGTHDVTVTAPVHVSGVCTNGVISCDTGTWSDCKYYLWDAHPVTHRVGMVAASLPDMKACYCVNNSCGANLALANKDDILSDLGGGMVAALSKAEPRYTVSQTAITGTSILYSGQQSTACQADPALPETAFYTNASAMSGDAWSETATNDVYTAATSGAILTGEAETTHACHTNRVMDVEHFTYNDIVSVSGSFEWVQSCGTGCMRYRIKGKGKCYGREFHARFNVLEPDLIDKVTVTRAAAADWIQVRHNGTPVAWAGPREWLNNGPQPGGCGVGSKTIRTMNVDLTPGFQTGGLHTVTAKIVGKGFSKWGEYDIEVRAKVGCIIEESISDTCGSYTGSPTCRMVQETADGVDTFVNGVHTGLHPLASTRTIVSPGCAIPQTRPWWDQTRTFACKVEGAIAPTIDLSRVDYVLTNSDLGSYADKRDDGKGGFITDGGTLSPPDLGLVGECELSCKVSRGAAQTQVSDSGVTGQLQTSPASGVMTAYKACTTSGVCPLSPGESIVTDCQCTDAFPEAFVMMQAVRLAGQGTVCTTGRTPVN
ncbi:MAG: hypothetical protein AAF862_14410 [Pseudomonadota bacterium]